MIRLRGARHHHLQLDLDLDPGSWTAIVGPSGSGKTTLVHDTLVAEGRRRWLAQLSGPARRLLGKAGRPALDALDGLPLPVAVTSASTGSERSTVGTRSGVLDLLRLLWARESAGARASAGDPARSCFSFNHPLGACPACQGRGVEDAVDPSLLVADPTKSLRDGALVPTLTSGYTVYSQVTVAVMDELCHAHGFTIDTPWEALDDAQRHMVFFGTDRLVVPFGKHDLASRMRWSGITARPREEGHYKGLIPVIEETLKRNRNPNILRFVRSRPCPACGGSRLGEVGRTAAVEGLRLPEATATPLRDLLGALAATLHTPTGRVLAPSLRDRVGRLVDLDLGHLTLDRTLPTLSGGEAQRLALAALLGTELSGMLFAFDEPTLGLHPAAQPGLHRALEAVRARGNTLVTVEHDPAFVHHADRVVALGPGSGVHGGRIVADGPADGEPLGGPPQPREPRPHRGVLWLRGARRHNLQGDDLPVHLGVLNVVLGRSGAGKSTLVMDCLLPALRGDPQGGSLDGPRLPVTAVDASPLGRTPRSTPATWTAWFDLVRKRFAATDKARALGQKAGDFAYNGKGGCEACEGLGVERIRLHLLDDLLRPCPECGGGRYRPEALQVRWRGLTVADVLDLSVDEAAERLGDDEELGPLLHAMGDLGLGHVPLGQPSPTLSRGEAQRVRLATTLAAVGAEPSLLLLDEPDRGLHPSDLQRLIRAFDRLVAAGHTLVAISHHPHLWAAADQRVEVEEGRLRLLPSMPSLPPTTPRRGQAPTPNPSHIQLRGVRTHHLKGLDLDLPHRALVGIVGVSGSGKSSLALGTLAAEADRRLAETLPFAVRRHLRRLPRPVLDHADGLTPTIALRQAGPSDASSERSTVGTALDVDSLLRLLVSRAGRVDGVPTDLSAAHFSPNRPEGACTGCHGRGTARVATEAGLVTDPGRALGDGALAGTRTGAYLGEPEGQFLATLAAALEHRGLAPAALRRPWSALPDEVRDVALHGAGDVVLDVRWAYSRGKRSGEHRFTGPWPGLLALAEEEARRRAGRKDAEAWAAHLEERPCPACEGEGIGPEARAVEVGGHGLASLRACPVGQLLGVLDGVAGEREAAVVAALRPELARRVDDAVALGLGALPLHTPTATLSGADRQRLRLAGVLGSGLTALTLVLDEPGAGLPDEALPALLARLRQAVDDGNTVVVVTHRVPMIRAMDHLVELGPGRGSDGGCVVAQGTVAALTGAGTPTGRLLAAPEPSGVLPPLPVPTPERGVWAVVAWPEGVAPVVSARGLDRRHTVLDALGGLSAMQKLFAAHGDLPARAFSFRSPAGRCETCGGSGQETVALDVLADLELPCPACEGRRYRPEVLAVRWPSSGDDVARWLDRPVDDLVPALEADGSKPARELLGACRRLGGLGLGGLSFGRALGSLSGGEQQRIVLAAMDPREEGGVVLLEQPDRGLHGADLPAVAERLRALGERHLVLVQGVRPELAALLA